MPPLSNKEIDSEALKNLAENERHFHTIQAGVRGLASSWTLAAFAGIAVLLQQKKDITWIFQPFTLVMLVCLMASFGLSILWIIDQLVYQRLFNTNYFAGLRLEQQFSSIPPVRAIQRLTTQERSIADWVKFFYVGPILAFAVTALIPLVNSIFPPNTTKPAITLRSGVMAVGAILTVAPGVWVWCHAREVSFFFLAKSLPGELAAILEKDSCRKIIDRHLDWLKNTEAMNAVNAKEAMTENKSMD